MAPRTTSSAPTTGAAVPAAGDLGEDGRVLSNLSAIERRGSGPIAVEVPEAEREIARAEADQLAWRELVRDELRSIRTTMALLGALGVVALGIAVWALLSDDSDGARGSGASAAQVSELERRLEDVRSEVERRPSSSAIASLRARQQALEEQIADALRRMEQTSGEVRAVEQRVDDLEQRSPTPTPAGTP